jgi:hypothetical protein
MTSIFDINNENWLFQVLGTVVSTIIFILLVASVVLFGFMLMNFRF